MEARKIIMQLAYNTNGDWLSMYNALCEKKFEFEPADVEQTEQKLFTQGWNYLTIIDEKFNQNMKNCIKTPLCLFYKGDINLLNSENRKVAYVGSRETNNYNKMAINDLMEKEQDDTIIVATLGTEITEFIVECALFNNLKMIIITNKRFNKREEKLINKIILGGGLIITEHPNGYVKDYSMIMQKYRLIACVADEIICANIRQYSSYNILITYALDMGKDIKMIPQPIDEKEWVNNELINEGALVATC